VVRQYYFSTAIRSRRFPEEGNGGDTKDIEARTTEDGSGARQAFLSHWDDLIADMNHSFGNNLRSQSTLVNQSSQRLWKTIN
jgi:hypothetical protein